jgi:signal transduction histidine kinase
MHELVGRTERIARGDRDAFSRWRITAPANSRSLSKSFLDMAEQLSRRSEYIATFSAHLTHELKSPLTSIKGASELLLESMQSRTDTLTRMEQKNFVSNIIGDVDRLDTMTQRLRELARAESAPQNERSELSTVIAGLKSRYPTRAITADGCLDRSIGMSGEKALIVLSHLTDNAIRHNASSVRLEATSNGASVTLTVSNDGDPISESNRDKVFDAFFTTRRDTGGTGMGPCDRAGRHGEPQRIDPSAADRARRCVRAAIPGGVRLRPAR